MKLIAITTLILSVLMALGLVSVLLSETTGDGFYYSAIALIYTILVSYMSIVIIKKDIR